MTFFGLNKNAPTAAFPCACLEIRSRNEKAINSTRNRIYSLKDFTSYFIDVDTFNLFLIWFSTRVSEDRKYVWGRRLCLVSREITSLPEIKKSDLHGASFQSSPKINRMLITRAICLRSNTIAVLLIKILIFLRPLSSVHLFQSNQRFQAIKFVSFLRKTCVASITQRLLVPVSTVSARNAWHDDSPFVSQMRRKHVADYESRCLRKWDWIGSGFGELSGTLPPRISRSTLGGSSIVTTNVTMIPSNKTMNFTQ